MDWIERVGIIVGIVVGVTGLFAILWRIMHRVDRIWDAAEATPLLSQKIDDLVAEVIDLKEYTTRTFATRTEDFQRIAAEAGTRLREAEREVTALKIRFARQESRLDAHAIEDDRRFERIELLLADIQGQLRLVLGNGEPPTAPTATIPLV